MNQDPSHLNVQDVTLRDLTKVRKDVIKNTIDKEDHDTKNNYN